VARTLFSVLRPLVVPGIATTVLYAFLFSLTEFVGALTFLTSNNLYTLPLALLNMEYGSVGQVNFGYLEGGVVIAMLPCIPLYRPAALLHPRSDVRRGQGVTGGQDAPPPLPRGAGVEKHLRTSRALCETAANCAGGNRLSERSGSHCLRLLRRRCRPTLSPLS
jgi:hypothetical protein